MSRSSPRRLPERLPVWIYPAAWCQHRINPDGRLYWQGRQRFIGLQRQQAGVWKTYLGPDFAGRAPPAGGGTHAVCVPPANSTTEAVRHVLSLACPRCLVPVPKTRAPGNPKTDRLQPR